MADSKVIFVPTSPSGAKFKTDLDGDIHTPYVIIDGAIVVSGQVDQGNAGTDPWPVDIGASGAVSVYNLTLTLADTEYSQALPANTREVRFRCRTVFDVRYAFVTGKVATPTAPYLTLPAGMEYHSDGNDLAGFTLYFASSQAGVVVEIEAWVA